MPHGFRSSFGDWAAECTDAPREVCELAHVNTNRIEGRLPADGPVRAAACAHGAVERVPGRDQGQGESARQMTGGEPHGHWRVLFCIGRAEQSAGIQAGPM